MGIGKGAVRVDPAGQRHVQPQREGQHQAAQGVAVGLQVVAGQQRQRRQAAFAPQRQAVDQHADGAARADRVLQVVQDVGVVPAQVAGGYLQEVSQPPAADFFRPHFFVNTPDINPAFLQTSGRGGFLIRAALAALGSGLWGVYSGFELCEAAPVPGKEEYLDSEKYELRQRDWRQPTVLHYFQLFLCSITNFLVYII